MKKSINEMKLLERAIESFQQQTTMGVELKLPIHYQLNGTDAMAVMKGETFRLFVKTSITNQNLHAVLYELTREVHKKPVVLVTRYINPNLMDKLRDEGVFCIDTAGNAFIQKGAIYIFIKGNKLTEEQTIVKSNRAFQYAGLKVIFALLQNPNLIQQTYREIAEQADVALGSVGCILRDLVQQGYVQKEGNNRSLVDKDRLTQNWVEYYPKLKQKHFLGSFTTESTGWWKTIDIAQFDALWGGEIAAETYTHYLQAKDGVVFIPQEMMGELIKTARLKKLKTENEDSIRIEFVETFWKEGAAQKNRALAPALLVYADLINSNYARNLETAQRLYEQYLS
ncbi:type IV toxin-antitoxin system AbiEi family antitoxin [Hydrogenovibrio sp. 3SP14C1]|uniref:type IV toxin-antitoxin system AbiEi family antitoxin n=1 Tax=Hydrogenovibrio sp. 3SP14C1 TaxID=3038774 RepID=UPI0024173FAE|nr:type IV toxin-antitoxin system AbiEi family antitoxin [Hydrogenovibrio sp. 3SP14C1]MDG4813470.1 type IV toxin-antitoxin system AbiEi family antitoxin [Hydrogenovibrio sp. 3SP14C1]